ncbi:MAG: glycosyl hydrolase family 8 [Vampirovibrionales bacterium]|nr:glycosyl hydrolase family 8 [Vampirovibrionales bacterium]
MADANAFSSLSAITPETGNAQDRLPAIQNRLGTTWQAYKSRFIQADGRVKDLKAGSITTSEGQSYALQRAVWQNDRAVFDTVYTWSVNNLQKPRGDALFAWKWGRADDGAWRILDKTAASDADQDIALALLMAAERWQHPDYKTEAMRILADFWQKETLETPFGRILLPGDWQIPPEVETRQLNPSYCAPYAYRIFAEADPGRPWKLLIDSCYTALSQSMALAPTGLPPDWVEFSLKTGEYSLFGHPTQDDPRSDFGYEAMRAAWRLQVDAWLSPAGNKASKPLREKIGRYMMRYFWLKRAMPGPLTPEGIERKLLDSNAVYGALYPLLAEQHPPLEPVLWTLALDGWQYNATGPNAGLWQHPDDYYGQNWLWFGLWLRLQQLTSPYTSLQPKTLLARYSGIQ